MTIPEVNDIPPYELPYGPVPQITPFTYRDGLTMLKKLDSVVKYMTKVIIPYINEHVPGLEDAFNEAVNNIITSVNAALLAQDAEVDQKIAEMEEYVDAAVDSIINSSIAVQDPVVAGIINNAASQTRAALNNLYASKATQTTVETGRLSAASLDAAYAAKSAQTTIESGRLTQANLDASYAAKSLVDPGGRLSDAELKKTFTRVWNYDQIVMLGDSLTAGTYPDLVAEALPWATTVKAGFSGYTTTEVAAKWGAPFTLAAFTVPAGAVGQTVTVTAPTTAFAGGSWTGELRNGSTIIPGTLTLVSGVYTFTRTTAGASTPVAGRIEFVCTEYDAYKTATLVVGAGRNNITSIDVMLRDFNAILEAHRAPNSAVLFLSIPLGNNEKTDTENYFLVTQMNNAIKEKFPNNYVDDFDYIRNRGMGANGLTPTSTDADNIAFGTIPDSLVSDGLHLNAAGNRAKAVAVMNGLARVGAVKGARSAVPSITDENPVLPLIWDASTVLGSDNNVINAWYDKYGRKMTGTGSARPSLQRVNGRKVIRFDGVDDRLNFAVAADINQPVTVIAKIILRSVAGKNHGLLWPTGGQTVVINSSGNLAIGGGPTETVALPVGTPTVIGVVMNGTTFAQVSHDNIAPVNGVMPNNNPAITTAGFSLGYSWAGSDAFANIDVMHFAIFKGVMSNAAIQNYGTGLL